ncbi:MAG: hypothetical protein KME27_30015 [Lyngbya sp. HA4199-MV5]|jgi:hypothetical protein|nr:hypothetical protein [Lyngbya sp. HA4199-MV5]
MSNLHPNLAVKQAFNGWLHEQILSLSLEALNVGAVTCTACAKSASGEYVIEYCGIQFRYSAERTYAFLHFVLHCPSTFNLAFPRHNSRFKTGSCS